MEIIFFNILKLHGYLLVFTQFLKLSNLKITKKYLFKFHHQQQHFT